MALIHGFYPGKWVEIDKMTKRSRSESVEKTILTYANKGLKKKKYTNVASMTQAAWDRVPLEVLAKHVSHSSHKQSSSSIRRNKTNKKRLGTYNTPPDWNWDAPFHEMKTI